MKVLGFVFVILIASVYLALTHLELVMKLGALKFSMFETEIYLAPTLLLALVSSAILSGFYVLMNDAREVRLEFQNAKKPQCFYQLPSIGSWRNAYSHLRPGRSLEVITATSPEANA